MDLMAAIGLLSSIVTLEEAGRSWVLIVKDKLKRKEIDINNWDSDDPRISEWPRPGTDTPRLFPGAFRNN
jgi:hypothetical protein